MLKRLKITNYGALSDFALDVGGLNVLFGPNGCGKTTFLDALWFLRHCNGAGVVKAAERRDQGVGLLNWSASETTERICVELTLEEATYEARFGFLQGRLDPHPGETLRGADGAIRFAREAGEAEATFHRESVSDRKSLREPSRLSIDAYLYHSPEDVAAKAVERFFKFAHLHSPRAVPLFNLKTYGSQADPDTILANRALNLWSVLRNLKDRARTNPAYDTIRSHMREAFPGFVDLEFEQTGAQSIYVRFVERWEEDRTFGASRAPDGMLQMLVNLVALFCEPKGSYSLLLFDEPETSLHPWATIVFARAAELAAREWNRQIFIATHSPSLLSQFAPDDVIEFMRDERGALHVHRVSEIEEERDLIERYAMGSLYMAGTIGRQRDPLRSAALSEAR